MKKVLVGLAFMALLGISCEDELVPTPERSERIGYDVSVNKENWRQVSTRGAASDKAPIVTVASIGQTLGGKPLYLHTTVENSIPDGVKGGNGMAQTRGSELTAISQFNYSAGVYDGTWSESVTMTPFVIDERVDLNQQGQGFTNHFWPKNHSFIRFYAASTNGEAQGLDHKSVVVLPKADKEPQFAYTVPHDITYQADLLTTAGEYAGDYCKAVPLMFDHALTAVHFKLSEVTHFTIKSLTLRGVKNSGTYTYSCQPATTGEQAVATHDAGGWSNQAMALSTGETTTEYTLYFGTDESDAANPKLVTDIEQGELSGWECAGDIVLNESGSDYVLMMMPQELTADAEVVIRGYDAILDKEVELTAEIGVDANGNALSWEKGKRVTYSLSLSDVSVTYYFNVEQITTDVMASEVPWYGATGLKYQVTDSYKIITRSGKNSEKYAVDWKVVYPTTALKSSTGEATGKVISYIDSPTIAEGELQEGVISGTDEATVGSYGVVTTDFTSVSHGGIANHTSHVELTYSTHPHLGTADAPYDLSTLSTAGGAPKNTANCYPVSAPGYYQLPLVYGNGIVGGNTNSSAYTCANTAQTTASAMRYKADAVTEIETRNVGVTPLPAFLDHMNTAITNPWIVSSRGGKYEAASVEIVWQDEPFLLSEVKLNASGDYLQFRVREDCICEGNAVVAVKDANGVIMWSWHIWVTDYRNIYDNGWGVISYNNTNVSDAANGYIWELASYDLTNRRVHSHTPSTNWTFQEETFGMLPSHIGHCDGEKKSYAGRKGSIQFIQVDNGEEVKSNFAATGYRSIEIVQGGGEGGSTVVDIADNAVYYQYGRKDPIPGGLANGQDKPCYGNDGKPVALTVSSVQAATLGEAIQNPFVFYTRGTGDDGSDGVALNNWCAEWRIYNLWNANSNVLPMFAHLPMYYNRTNPSEFFDYFEEVIALGITKSVYDPCPPGYEMPRVDAFFGATYDGIQRKNYFDSSTNMLLDEVNIMPTSISSTAYEQAVDANGNAIYEDGKSVYVDNDYYDSGYNGISLFCIPMKQKAYYQRSLATDKNGPYNQTFFIQAFGCRGDDSSGARGQVIQFGNSGSVLSATPLCAQWLYDDKEYFQLEPSRFYFNLGPTWGTLKAYASSKMDYAFTVMPAKTGSNPYAEDVPSNPRKRKRMVTETELDAEYRAYMTGTSTR